MTAIDVPLALHRGENDLPWVDLGDGSDLQLLQVDVEAGLWVIRTRFQPGYLVPTHKHTGEVFAFTISGSWKYVEYPEVNTAGSYLFEPAGSVHTLTVPDDERGSDRRLVRHPWRQPQPRRGRQRHDGRRRRRHPGLLLRHVRGDGAAAPTSSGPSVLGSGGSEGAAQT